MKNWKTWLVALVLAALPARPAFAQAIPVDSSTPFPVVVPASSWEGRIASDFVSVKRQFKGKLDLTSDPEAVVFRDAHYGMWLAGAQDQIWELDRLSNGAQVMHVSVFWVTRLEGQDTMYGPSVGVNIGQGVSAAASEIEFLAPLANWTPPPFVSKFGQYSSVEGFVGYRFTTSPDDGHWGYGFGFKVTIPISEVIAFAAGTNGAKGL